MGRLSHLRETLPYNLANNHYKDLEFVLLDYNSQDGLEQWVKSELMSFIDSGRLSYFKISSPKFWRIGHAKNLSIRASIGDIVCNIDADNRIKDFAEYVADAMAQPNDILCAYDVKIKHRWWRKIGRKVSSIGFNHAPVPGGLPRYDACGRICVRRETVNAVGGYDERFAMWGSDDLFFESKCKLSGCNIKLIDRKHLDDIIEHSYEDRQVNCEIKTADIKSAIDFSAAYYVEQLNNKVVPASWGVGKLRKNFTSDIELL